MRRSGVRISSQAPESPGQSPGRSASSAPSQQSSQQLTPQKCWHSPWVMTSTDRKTAHCSVWSQNFFAFDIRRPCGSIRRGTRPRPESDATAIGIGTVSATFVSDLRHFLDMPDDAPGPARRMAGHLGGIVKAATASESGEAWVSALPCHRRPNRQPCEGTIAVFRTDLPPTIEWRCTGCGDIGVISGWEGSYFDLRGRKPQDAETVSRSTLRSIEVTPDAVFALREIEILDLECERAVFAASGRVRSPLLGGDRRRARRADRVSRRRGQP